MAEDIPTAKPFVFSINPRFVAMFRAGTKRRLRTRTAEELWRAEFRTRRPKVSPGERHLIYETAPTMRVVAIATIGEIIEGTPAEVWALTQGPGGISRVDYDDYFGSGNRAVAIEMSMAWLEVPLELPDGMRAPQSWARWAGRWPL